MLSRVEGEEGGSRGRDRERGRSGAKSTREGEGGAIDIPKASVFRRLGTNKAKGKKMAVEPVWIRKDFGRAPLNYSEKI